MANTLRKVFLITNPPTNRDSWHPKLTDQGTRQLEADVNTITKHLNGTPLPTVILHPEETKVAAENLAHAFDPNEQPNIDWAEHTWQEPPRSIEYRSNPLEAIRSEIPDDAESVLVIGNETDLNNMFRTMGQNVKINPNTVMVAEFNGQSWRAFQGNNVAVAKLDVACG